jgi:hypothetical protein
MIRSRTAESEISDRNVSAGWHRFEFSYWHVRGGANDFSAASAVRRSARIPQQGSADTRRNPALDVAPSKALIN